MQTVYNDKGQRPVIAMALFIVLIFVTAMSVRSAWAAPRALPQECKPITEVALVARAAAEEEIPAEQAARILSKVFMNEGARNAWLTRLILDAAYRTSLSAMDFARLLGFTCVRKDGDLDSILGEGV